MDHQRLSQILIHLLNNIKVAACHNTDQSNQHQYPLFNHELLLS
ncbi:Uncharacterised protein [Vibrio cholerae]|nr:Uncharacterised protein [Vibrio cholerae]CSI53401.1 Uncharacterised protein [Vibrio cholerae]